MAGINSAQVYLPSPDQTGTVGAVAVASIGVTAPTDARTALPTNSWTSGGYVSEDGISLGLSRGLTPIKDWSQATVRNALTEFTGTVSCAFLQVDKFAAEEMFGASNVTVTPANATHGEQIAIAIGAELAPAKAWCWSMKDGNRRVRVFLPNAQVTELGDISFVPGAGNIYPATVSAYPDSTGKSVYVFYDDGEVVSG